VLLILTTLTLISADAPTNYHQDFQTSADGSLPEELLVINGTFTVKSEGDQKFLQLPGEPLDTFGFMLGADDHNSITTSIRATNTGKRFPEFGIGLCGAAGWQSIRRSHDAGLERHGPACGRGPVEPLYPA